MFGCCYGVVSLFGFTGGSNRLSVVLVSRSSDIDFPCVHPLRRRLMVHCAADGQILPASGVAGVWGWLDANGET